MWQPCCWMRLTFVACAPWWQDLSEPESTVPPLPPPSRPQDQCMVVVANALYYNAALTLALLQQQGPGE